MTRRRIWLLMALMAGGLMAWAYTAALPPDRVWLVTLDMQGREVSNIVWPPEKLVPHVDRVVVSADKGYWVIAEGRRGGLPNVLLSRLRPGEDTQWKCGFSLPSWCAAICRVAHGYVLAGYLRAEDAQRRGAALERGFWLLGVSETGDSLWFCQWETTLEPSLKISEQPQAGGTAIAVVEKGTGEAYSRLELLRFSTGGQFEGETVLFEAAGEIGCAGLVAAADSGYWIAATHQQSFERGSSGTSWLLRADKQGVVCWQRTLDQFEGGGVALIGLLSNGHLLLGGHSRDPETNLIRWTATKVKPSGDAIWTRRYLPGHRELSTTAGPMGSYAHAVRETEDHRYQFAGNYYGQGGPHGWLFTVSEDGDSLESRGFLPNRSGGNFQQILPGPEGGVILAGAAYAPREE